MGRPSRFPPEPIDEPFVDRAVLVGADRGGLQWPIEESLAELERLAETAGAEILGTVTQKMRSPDPRTFIGKGKVEEVAKLAQATEATLVVFDDDLSPSQQASLEEAIPGAKIVDRTALILDIFALHATSREGKLQVELAQMEYLLPRLRGMWRHLGRLGKAMTAGIGTRGPGESQLETDRRIARKRIAEVRRELKGVAAERTVQRKARARSGIYRVSLVGYTNAGKSTLLNALTGAGALVADQLFATLDATTRTTELPEGRKVTVTDTVGFINKLPHGLVEAFKSTLDETREADLLLHVVDAASTQAREQMDAVAEVLGEIGVAGKDQVVVFNKADLLSADERAALAARQPHAVLVSAATGEGLDRLLARIAAEAARSGRTMTLLVPYDHGEIVALAHERAQVVSEDHTGEGTRVVVQAPAELAARFEPYEERDDAAG